MNHVILHILDAHDQVANQAGIVGDLYVQGIFHGPDAGHGVNRGADTTEALGEMMCITGIATLENRLDATEGRGRAPGVNNLATIDLCLDAQVALYTGNRINGNSFSHRLVLLYDLVFFHSVALAEAARNPMDTESHCGGRRQTDTNLVGRILNSKTGDLGQAPVEGTHGVPETRFRTTDAAVTGHNRPGGAFVVTNGWAIVKSFRAFAAQLVETMPLTVRGITEGFGILARMFGPVGRMALTNYLVQGVFIGLVLYGFHGGLALAGQIEPKVVLPICLGFFALQIVFSQLWLARYRYGPMEWLWRSLTYGERPTMRAQPA